MTDSVTTLNPLKGWDT